jgi:hypothetical protein
MSAMTDLIAIRDLTRTQVDELLDIARELLPIARRERNTVPTLRGRIVCTLFLEDSTRTRLSFDLAAKRLSADVVSFSSAGTSVNKGESLLDTAETLRALGVDLIVLRTASAGAPAQLAREVDIPGGPFDAVLVDAPCTGTGVLSSRPDARWRRREEALAPLVEIQQGLLARALELAAPGGRVVYSTCSLLREEDEDVVRASGADVDDLTADFPGMESPDLPGTLRLLPHVHGSDGFFVARLRGR